jgi:hypothetical protein
LASPTTTLGNTLLPMICSSGPVSHSIPVRQLYMRF